MEDSLHRILGGLVLPDADHRPAGFMQRSVGTPVALDVATQLGRPIPLVTRGLSSMDGADMPEAAIHEDSNFPASEDDVWPNADSVQVESVIFAEPVAERMEGGAKPDLRFRVDASVRLHVPRPADVERFRAPGCLGDHSSILHEASLRAMHV
jgi:hypothetical protein